MAKQETYKQMFRVGDLVEVAHAPREGERELEWVRGTVIKISTRLHVQYPGQDGHMAYDRAMFNRGHIRRCRAPGEHGGKRPGSGRKPNPTKTYSLRLPVAEGLRQEAAAREDGMDWSEMGKRALALYMAIRAVARGELAAAAVPAALWPSGDALRERALRERQCNLLRQCDSLSRLAEDAADAEE